MQFAPAVSVLALIMVPKKVAAAPTCTERLVGNSAETRVMSELLFPTKLALIVLACARVTWQIPTPTHPPPLQPVKVEPEAADAVNVTIVFGSKLALQVALHEIPEGLLVIVPEPLPTRVTDNINVTGATANAAVTVVSESTTTVQGVLLMHPPPLHA